MTDAPHHRSRKVSTHSRRGAGGVFFATRHASRTAKGQSSLVTAQPYLRGARLPIVICLSRRRPSVVIPNMTRDRSVAKLLGREFLP